MKQPLSDTVQEILRDERLTPRQRGEEAAMRIDRFVRAEKDIAVNVALPVPPEWQHRVPLVEEREDQVVLMNYNGDNVLAPRRVPSEIAPTSKKGWFRR